MSSHPLVLAAAAISGVEEIYAMGGAQAIFALAYGTDTIAQSMSSPARATPGYRKRSARFRGLVGIDSYAGPSELMVVAGRRRRSGLGRARSLRAGGARGREPAARRRRRRGTCSTQSGSAASRRRLARTARASRTPRLRSSRSPTPSRRIDLANAFAPEHLELIEEDAERARRPGHNGGLRLRRPQRRHRVRRLRRRLQPRACRRPARALRRGPSGPHRSAARSQPSRSPPRRRRSLPRTSTRSPAPRASPSTPSRR